MLSVGTALGQYVVRSVVDSGELSNVFGVEHTVLGTRHALKILVSDDEDTVARSLHTGARLQATIEHPHVVRCTDAGVWQGFPWMVMDWMNGGSLAAWLDAKGAMAVPVALRLFRGITRGLHAIHVARVVHRDLKPQNVLFAVHDGRRTPKITDLGLAKILERAGSSDQPTLSHEYKTIGTPEYMAPEQSADAAGVDERADLFSLGVLLYEMLTNEVPYEDAESWRVLVAARMGRYRPMRELRAEIPPDVEQLVAELLRPTREERLPSCEAVLSRLDRLVPKGPDVG